MNTHPVVLTIVEELRSRKIAIDDELYSVIRRICFEFGITNRNDVGWIYYDVKELLQ